MHYINRLLSSLGVGLVRANRHPAGSYRDFLRNLKVFKKTNKRNFIIVGEFFYDAGDHPKNFVDFECQFAAMHLARLKPASILDVGSYRWFLLGLLSGYRVDTLDVRAVESELQNEKVIVSDAKKLCIADGSYAVVTSLCAIEHFGLGRYGDAIDQDADLTAIREMIRVLEPGGHLIFSTTYTSGKPLLIFNGHRIYNIEMIHNMLNGLELIEEKFYSHQLGSYCNQKSVSTPPKEWDIYMGCWRKPPM